METPDGRVRRYIDQLCFFSREDNRNRIYMVIKDGELISGELPPDIKKKMRYAQIKDPFVCEKLEEYIAEGK
jgi:pilus assembly protein CpaF